MQAVRRAAKAAVLFVLGVLDVWAKSVIALLALGALGLTFAGAAPDEARLTDIRFGVRDGGARVVLDLSRPVSPKVFTLGGGQNRIVIDLDRRVSYELSNGRWLVENERGQGPGEGPVAQYRYAYNTPQTSRIVLDLGRPALVTQSFTIAPSAAGEAYRIVLDLEEVDQTAFDASQGFPVETLAKAADQAGLGRSERLVVVIDPGHGGRDPGAVSKSGFTEKTANFETAKALEKILEKTGRYRVVLTRDDDSFLNLGARTELARKAEADLFISLHADAHHDPTLRGASVYTLSERASDDFAEKLREDGDFEVFDVDIHDKPPEVGDILMDLAQRETKSQSAKFAQLLIPHLEDRVPLLNNTHRRAAYKVLLAPDVPAVLVEMAFMSSASDEKNLRSEAWRKTMAEALAAGIDEYFDHSTLRQAALN